MDLLIGEEETRAILKESLECIPKGTRVYLVGGTLRNALYYRYFGIRLPSRDYDLFVSGNARRFILNLRKIGFAYGKLKRKDQVVVKRRKFAGAKEDSDKVVFDIDFCAGNPRKTAL